MQRHPPKRPFAPAGAVLVALLSVPALAAPPADLAPYFDANASVSDTVSVVGTLTQGVAGWGAIELLEGHQRFRHEDYNDRTEKLRDQDTFQTADYPLGTYFGALNQALVRGFNLHYGHACATAAASTCPAVGPTRPEARFVLLHKGPQTAARTCNVSLTPMLLVHGAIQDANVWLFPNGHDGNGNAYGGATQVTGLVQSLEGAGRCTYAVTFGNFHGDNYNQAIHVANAIRRIKALHPGVPRVDVVAWSKGVLAADAYLANAPSWSGFSTTRFFERLAREQASEVPAYRDDIRVYVALSGPHKGIDLNFRHPIHTLTIASTSANAPVGRGPMPWTYFSAFQCVTWGPEVPWYDNPYAQGVCEGAGATWPDYFRRIHISNLTGLSASGLPVSGGTLQSLNVAQGLPASAFDFDAYNLSLFGSVDDSGRYVNAYLGQLQAAADLRGTTPIPDRTASAWSDVDPDEARYYPWLDLKLAYNPYNPWIAAGYVDDDDHRTCRTAAFDPVGSPCFAYHAYNTNQNREGTDALGYGRYRILQGLGIGTATELGGRFIQRLSERGLDPRLPSLLVLHGTTGGSDPAGVFETDGMSSPTGATGGDGVLLQHSIAAVDQLTQGWSATKKAADATQQGLPYSHLAIGVTPAAWTVIQNHVAARD